ncbi:MAG: hypothetical protein QM734_07505 [Cyclobacteriaceae bacterium]
MPAQLGYTPENRRKKKAQVSPADEFINELIKKRKLQQEALLKIMTSMDAKKKAKSKSSQAKKTKKKAKST